MNWQLNSILRKQCFLSIHAVYRALELNERHPGARRFSAGRSFAQVGYFNSGLNPIIYAFYNREFRRAFKRLLGFRSKPMGPPFGR